MIMAKNKLVIKMRNYEHRADIVCTLSFVGRWEAEGFTPVGYTSVHPSVSVMDISSQDIEDNLYTGEE
jgi:hypothetical protein